MIKGQSIADHETERYSSMDDEDGFASNCASSAGITTCLMVQFVLGQYYTGPLDLYNMWWSVWVGVRVLAVYWSPPHICSLL